MHREAIISFIETIRPQIKEAGAPEEVLLKAAREKNLAPAQVESTAQLLNTAQQLNFMDKSASRGDTFKLIDVPKLISDYTKHETPKQATTNTGNNYASQFSKAAFETPVPESQSKRIKQGSTILVSDPSLNRPLQGKRIPNINQMVRKDAGVRDEFMSLGEEAASLPRSERSLYKEYLQKEAQLKFEREGIAQMIDDAQECLRKEAEHVAYRLRTEPGFVWAEAKSDGMVLNKEAMEKVAPVVEHYLGQLSGHRKVAFAVEPSPHPSVLVDDRHNFNDTTVKMAQAIEQIEKLTLYREHIEKEAAADTKRPPKETVTNEEEEGDSSERKSESKPSKRTFEDTEESGDVDFALDGEPSALGRLEEIITPPNKMDRPPEEIHDEINNSITNTADSLASGLKKVPGPRAITDGARSIIESIAPKINKPQKALDSAINDTKTTTTLQRMMLTDPIIRDADPNMVVSLFNTLQNANPEVVRDPNLLRFALRESLQYESVPMHTYKDLVEVEEKKNKSVDTANKIEDKRYAI